MTSASEYRLGVDVGGTFTDFVLQDESSGDIHIAKSLTTYPNPSTGILEGLVALDAPCPDHVTRTRHIAHATTLIANAVIERKGARTALLATKGFRDVLELRRHVRVTNFELWADPPEPLVPRWLRLPINERTYADGSVLKPVRREDIAQAIEIMRQEDVTSVAVVFLHSYVNPDNERAARDVLADLAPDLAVTLSSDVLPQIKEFERSSTTVVNGYVKPLGGSYLGQLGRGLREVGYAAPLNVMLSNGGLGATDTAAEFPIRLIESGPVAGAILSRHLAELMDLPTVLSFDMGGTTAKACLIRDHALPITEELEVARNKRFTKSSGYPIGVPAVNMIEVGAGGGSIASVNAMGIVQVGPESASSDPGPICYGHGGTEPTVTDADLVLGYLDPDYFAGGAMALDPVAAADGIRRAIGEVQNLDLLRAAWTIHDVVNESMVTAVRMHVTERGGNPESATLVAFGGAGPGHAWNLARKLRLNRILVPLRAGVLSALGLLAAPPAYDIVRTYKVALESLEPEDVATQMNGMAAEITLLLDGVAAEGEHRFTRAVDVGYVGQSYQVTVPIEGRLDAESVSRQFAALYREKYGYFYDDIPTEIVNLRVLGEIAHVGLDLTSPPASSSKAADPKGFREAYEPEEGRMIPFAVYDRETLVPGTTLSGPAIIEEATATTIVGTDGTIEIDGLGTIVITVETRTS